MNCVDLCNEILDEELLEGAPPSTPSDTTTPPITDIPKPQEIKSYLDQHIVGSNYG